MTHLQCNLNRDTEGSPEDFQSRFFRVTDRHTSHFVFDLPPNWWSRPHEYAWASQHAHPGHIVLDAACGIGHPFKFFLGEKCRKVHACDIDERILSAGEMRKEIAREYGLDPLKVQESCLAGPVYHRMSITDLAFEDKTFDTIFCLSVLEHLSRVDLELAMKEFRRTLADDGTIVLTFDYPRIRLDEFEGIATAAGLQYVGSHDRTLASDSLFSPEFNLYCYRAVLKKAWAANPERFDYRSYWDERYMRGEGSGLGSRGLLAEFKAEVINRFISEHDIDTVVEYGCGDGNNLRYMNCPAYVGVDVSPKAVTTCRSLYAGDKTKTFLLYNPLHRREDSLPKGSLVVCLDVLYHVIPDEDYLATLTDVFSSATKYVILYTSIDAFLHEPYRQGSHIRHRDTLSALRRFPEFEIEKIVEQKYPESSSAHFVILRRTGTSRRNSRASDSQKRRIGFVTIWFERGQSYVTRTLRDALAREHDTYIFARTGSVDGKPMLQTDGVWAVDNLTTHPSYEISHDVFRGWVRRNYIDTVVFNEEYDWSLVAFARSLGIKVVTYLDYLKEDWLPKMHLYDAVLCSTRRSYDIVKNVCNAAFVGWGLDTDLFAPRDDGDQKYTFFHNAGWLGTNFRKMTPAAILAFDAISPLVPDATLLIHSQSSLERLPGQARTIVQSNPRISCHFGSVAAPGLYHKAKVLLFPTKLEGLGLPLFEALSTGLAVIATDAAPMNEFVSHGQNGLLIPVVSRGERADGILFPEEVIDVNAFARTMLELARNPRLLERLASQARRYALENLTLETFRQRVNALDIFNK